MSPSTPLNLARSSSISSSTHSSLRHKRSGGSPLLSPTHAIHGNNSNNVYSGDIVSGGPGLTREGSGNGKRGGQLGRLRSNSAVQSLGSGSSAGGTAGSLSTAGSGSGSRRGSTSPGDEGSHPFGSGSRSNGQSQAQQGVRLGRPFSYLPPLATTGAIILDDISPISNDGYHNFSHPYSSSASSPRGGAGGKYSPGGADRDGEGRAVRWEDEQALYQCMCVATFRLDIEIWYAGLKFLSIEEGNVIE